MTSPVALLRAGEGGPRDLVARLLELLDEPLSGLGDGLAQVRPYQAAAVAGAIIEGVY